jgi:hypothetical protein
MNPIRKWTIACYEFLFAEPGIAWRDVVEQVEADFAQRQQAQAEAAAYEAWQRSLETEAIEIENPEDEPIRFPYSGFSIAGYPWLDDEDTEPKEDYEPESELENEAYGLVHYQIEALGGDTFMEFSYEGDLDEAAIVQALTYLWQTTPFRPNNQLVGTLQLPIAPAYSAQYFPFDG